MQSGFHHVRGGRRRQQPFDERNEHCGSELTRVGADYISPLVHGNQRRPRRYRETTPYPELPVVHNRMLCPEANRSVPDTLRHTLGMILTALYANDYQLLRVSRFELPQLREYVYAVNSTVGPEIEQNYLATQVRQPQCTTACVHPIQTFRKLGGSHRWKRGYFFRHESAKAVKVVPPAALSGLGVT